MLELTISSSFIKQLNLYYYPKQHRFLLNNGEAVPILKKLFLHNCCSCKLVFVQI